MKRIIETSKAPKAVGPYSQAVEINGTLYVSGQVPLNPQTMKVVNGEIKEQTLQVMKNIGAILEAAGVEPEQTGLRNQRAAETHQRNRQGETKSYSRHGHAFGKVFQNDA